MADKHKGNNRLAESIKNSLRELQEPLFSHLFSQFILWKLQLNPFQLHCLESILQFSESEWLIGLVLMILRVQPSIKLSMSEFSFQGIQVRTLANLGVSNQTH